MAIPQKTFDDATEAFTTAMRTAADWKFHYFGATYSTRLCHAIDAARTACDRLERIIKLDKADDAPPPCKNEGHAVVGTNGECLRCGADQGEVCR
jgi:hypothetical protein